MKLTIIGKYGPYPKDGGATSCYLLEIKNKKFLLDLGAGSFSRLKSLINPNELDGIILSHFHFDHSSDVGVFIYYCQGLFAKGRTEKFKVFCPSEGGIMASAVLECPYFDVTTVSGGEKFELDGISLEFFKMRHPVQCVGVKFFDGEKTFAYTGDTNTVETLDGLYENSNIVLADGAFTYSDWNENLPHLSVRHVADLTKKWGNKSIITHLNPKYTEEEIQREIKGYGDICQIAQEGKSYEL